MTVNLKNIEIYTVSFVKKCQPKRSVTAYLKYFGNKGFVKVSENTYNVKQIYCIISKELPLQIKIAVSILDDFT